MLFRVWTLTYYFFFFKTLVSFFIVFFNTLFIYFIYLFMTVLGLLVFVRGPSPDAASGGHSSSRCGGRSSSRCAGPPLPRPLPPRGTGSRRAGSAAVAHGPSCSAACGILPDQGSNPCPLHWQADSQPLRHQGSPHILFIALYTVSWRKIRHYTIYLFELHLQKFILWK